MKPIVDAHAHVFNGGDIPLKGYLQSRAYKEWTIRLLAPILFYVVAECIRRQTRSEEKGILCGLVLGAVYKYMGQTYRTWAEILGQEVVDIAARLVDEFEKDGISLYVPLMVDYEYWFEYTDEPPIARQINDMYWDVVLPFKGTIHPFAPFDPARELAYRHKKPAPRTLDDAGPPERYSSLDLVKDAILNKGFIGVKVYNTMGYRPFNNKAVDDQRRRIFRRNGTLQRYGEFTGEQFDEVLSDLYQFCVDEQVPITAHCVMDGVEAYPGASYDFGKPEFWRDVLSQEGFGDLRLNLAHFGWGQKQNYRAQQRWDLKRHRILKRRFYRNKSWIREICEMVNRYDYVFTDVSHHSVTVQEDFAGFRAGYEAMCGDFPGVLQKKLLFGIDWHVITRVENYLDFKDRYVEVLENLFTREEMGDFLGVNALNFLGLLPGGKNRARLADFYRRNNIDPPEWFELTG